VLIGGYSNASLLRAARLGDGYTGGNMTPAMIADLIRRFHEAALLSGRDPDLLPVVSRAAFHITDGPLGAGRRTFWGSLDQIRDDMRAYEASGVSELFLDPTYQPGGATLASVLAQMDLFAPAEGDGSSCPADALVESRARGVEFGALVGATSLARAGRTRRQ
jgi:alkanesulfonate monooxygenase SsuD/methylene tetrahydromethanopterin reductase-like flavin-dependent oxidoreductase (luciferase family)